MATNYPIVRLTSGSNVYYARTYDWSSTGVQTGSTPESTQFVLPAGLPSGSYSLSVIANGIASTPVMFTQFDVSSSTPGEGSIVSTLPLSFAVQFNVAYDPASVQTSGFTVNGVAASSYTPTNSTTITYQFASSPVTNQGVQNIALAAGSVDEQGSELPVPAFSTNFYYDVTQMAVTSVTPTNGSTVVLPFSSTIELGFNVAYAAGSINTDNLTLSQGTVTGYTRVDSTHVQYTVSGLTQEGTLNFSLTPGTITDAYGNPGPTFAGSYTLDYGTVAYPLPLTRVNPAGSLVYDPTVSGSINPVGDTDSFMLPLDAGQTLAVMGQVGAALQAQISISGPGFSASAQSAAAGAPVLIQDEAVPTTGTYTITISGLNATTGTYTLDAVVNAAIQTEGNGGANNDTLPTAQSLSGSFVSLGGGGSRGAVVGNLNYPTVGENWYSFNLTAGQTVSLDVSGTSNPMSLELHDSLGNLLAAGTPVGGNVDQAISDFTAPTTGTYYVRVLGTASTTYALAVSVNADFDNQNNSSIATAQKVGSQQVSGQQDVLGDIEAAGASNFYEVQMASGATLTALTSTPGDGTAPRATLSIR